MFIAFEGLDASGKATQSKRLAANLAARRIEFPTYGTEPLAKCGPVIEAHLKEQWSASWDVAVPPAGMPEYNHTLDAFVFQCLMATNKYELAPAIETTLDAGGHVVADRYWPSAYAYGGADGVNLDWILRVHRMLPPPDIMFLLDSDFETMVARRPKGRDRYEKRGADYFEKVAALYRKLWVEVGPLSSFWGSIMTRWVILDGRASEAKVTKQVNDVIAQHFGTIE